MTIRNSNGETFWALQDYLQVKPHGGHAMNRLYLNEVFCCYACVKDIIFGTL
jgi:NADH:ubiquinone oxidoreductase subunit E